MLNTIAVAALATLAATGAPEAVRDTTLSIPDGARVEVQHRLGPIRVRGTAGSQLRVELQGGPDGAVRVRRTGSVVRVSGPAPDRGRSARGEMRVRVPRGTDLQLRSMQGRIRVTDVNGNVEAQTMNGTVHVEGAAQSVRARTMNGSVVVSGARGEVDLYAASGGVRVTDVEGDARVKALSGGVTLRRVRADRISASTLSGDVSFSGPIRDRGSYELSTHSGSVRMSVPEGTNAAFELTVRSGDIDANFPLPGVETSGAKRTLRFALGDGSARVELSTYSGSIVLRRPNERGASGGRERSDRE